MKTPEFQSILNSCTIEGLLLEEALEKKILSPDEFLYKVTTNLGTFYIFEIDYISSLSSTKSRISSAIDEEFTLVPRIKPQDFESSSPVKSAGIYKKPEDWNEIQEYVSDKFGSEPFYFNFLVQPLV